MFYNICLYGVCYFFCLNLQIKTMSKGNDFKEDLAALCRQYFGKKWTLRYTEIEDHHKPSIIIHLKINLRP